MGIEPVQSAVADLACNSHHELGENEHSLLATVRDDDACGQLADLTAQRMRQIVQDRGIDFATALLFDRIRRSPAHGRAIAEIDGLDGASLADNDGVCRPVRVVIVPGFLHREYPASGADGRMLSGAAERLGWECQTIPVRSTGRLYENANQILAWLSDHDDGQATVLASVSKGGSDITAAMQLAGAQHAFRHVVGWVSVCGIVRGSQVVDRIARRWLSRLGFRLLFALRRWTFASVLDLRHSDGPLQQGFTPPVRMRIVHAVGFPLAEHFTHSRLRAFHRMLAADGPNDGAILPLDLLNAPGVLYPVWAADHYMRPRYRTQPLCEALLRYAAIGVTR